MRLRLRAARYRSPEERWRAQDRILARLRLLPGVERAAAASHLPLWGCSFEPVEPEGYQLPADGKPAPVATLTVSPGYFRTFGIRLIAGRQFLETDGGREQANAM